MCSSTLHDPILPHVQFHTSLSCHMYSSTQYVDFVDVVILNLTKPYLTKPNQTKPNQN